MTEAHFANSHLFRRLPDTLREGLYDSGVVSEIPPGASIVREGFSMENLYIVLSGTVEVVLPGKSEGVSDVKLDELGPGDCFGEYTFIDRQAASASIRAVDQVSLYAIPFDTLQKFLNDHPIVAAIVYRNLIEILVARLRASNAELDLFTV